MCANRVGLPKQFLCVAFLACSPYLCWAVPNPPVVLCELNKCTDQPLTGTFVDAPVQGLTFSTGSQSGVTNSAGSFRYAEGETIRFEYGGVEIGEALAKSILTPLDILPEQSELQVALMSFLQSLDADLDLSNGIELTSFNGEQLQSYVNEQPGSNTFASIIARDDYANLVLRLTTRSAWLSGPEALEAFNAEIAPLVAQGLYVVPTSPDPEPPPPPPTGGCSSQPTLHQSQIPSGPFSGCGFADRLQSPSPTEIRHILGHGSGQPITDGWESCILPTTTYPSWAFPGGTVNVTTSNQVYHNRSRVPGNLVFSGHDMVWRNVQEGSIAGNVVCNNCRNVEVDGVCYGSSQ